MKTMKLAWQTLKDRKISLMVYSSASAIFIWMYVAMFPAFRDAQEDFDKLIQSYPEGIFSALGIDASELSFSTIESFLGLEHYSIVWPIMAIMLTAAFGSAMIAGEIEKGTVETLLTQPISRLKAFFSKYLAGVVSLFIFTAVTAFAIVPFAELHNVSYDLESHLIMGVLGFLFGLAILSVSMFASSIFSEKSKANFFVGGLVMVMYVLNVVSGVLEKLEDLKYASIFYYFDFSNAINNKELDEVSVLVFLAITIAFTGAGALWFKNRDITV